MVQEPLRPVDAARLRRGIEAAAQQARKSGARRVGVVLSGGHSLLDGVLPARLGAFGPL